MYFVKRLAFSVPLLIVISALAFLLVHLAPGGPFDRERAPASPEIERNLMATYHLDEPIWKQYLRYFGLVLEKDASGNWHHAPRASTFPTNTATTASATSSRKACRSR